MKRTNYNHLCPICNHPDGCLYAWDGGAAICSRIKEGSVKTVGDGPFSGGYLHILKEGFKPKPMRKKRPISINWNILNQCYIKTWSKCHFKPFAVSDSALEQIETGWDGEAYTFSLRNSDDEITGIQRRFPSGKKRMVKGSLNGIFIPRLDWDKLSNKWCLFICEGVSDTATALDMGLPAIGRHNCGTGKDHIIKFCAKKKPQRIVIVADNDEAGVKGAKLLGREICCSYKLFTMPMPELKVIVPPAGVKDLRAWRADGLDTAELACIVDNHFEFKDNKNLLDFQP